MAFYTRIHSMIYNPTWQLASKIVLIILLIRFLFSIYLFINFNATSYFCQQLLEIDIVLIRKRFVMTIAWLNKIKEKITGKHESYVYFLYMQGTCGQL